MMQPLALVRPEPGWSRSAQAARDLGLTVIGQPLFTVAAAAWAAPDPDAVDALLLGSANALRFAGPALRRFAGKPAYAVGAATAEAAQAAGLDVVAMGEDDLQALASVIRPAHRWLLRLAGREHGAFVAPPGTEVVTRCVYAADAVPVAPDFARALHGGAVAALHSPRAAAHLAAECARLGIDRQVLRIAALSDAVRAAAGTGWAMSRSAPVPTDAALLALAAQMCKIAPDNNNAPVVP